MNEINLNESIIDWWNSMIKAEIKDATSIRSNEHIWELGSDSFNDMKIHSENVIKLDEYIKLLKSRLMEEQK